ncbi:related to monocarboxylate transporter [Fusarium oxysporum]|uniref:Related to monocarboxylate transporter n=1 Tax=Fusarium oxysporum TaxID=5507 RepID=A0A2H3UBG7_FUSOX|nr:related to monocarboxylate transporter [Fusarium oxysporum]
MSGTSTQGPQAPEENAHAKDMSVEGAEGSRKEDEIPNGGLTAWLQVTGSFFLFFNTWGIINSYGVFQTYYETGLLSTSNSSDISWIGSVQSFLIMFVGVITGPIYDAGYFRTLLITGAVLVVVGHMLLSICKSYWQIMLCQGVCIALGSGTLFVPGVAILPSYFTTRISLAVGIAASGSSLGGVIYPIIFHNLQPRLGFGWTVRVIGFIALFGLLLSILSMRMRKLLATRRKIIDWTAFREPPYMLFTLGIFLAFMGLYVPFYYVQLHAIDRGITNSNLGFYLLPILNAASVFGRIIPNYMADTSGPLNMMMICAMVSGILVFCLVAITKTSSLIVFCILYGFFSGAFVSLIPPILTLLSPKLGVIGTRMGMCFTIVAVGLLLGTPIAGAILSSHGFNAVWIYGGVFTLVGSACIIGARMFQAGWMVMTRV